MGKWHPAWHQAQDEYLKWTRSRPNSLRWASALVRNLIQVAWDMWHHRNRALVLQVVRWRKIFGNKFLTSLSNNTREAQPPYFPATDFCLECQLNIVNNIPPWLSNNGYTQLTWLEPLRRKYFAVDNNRFGINKPSSGTRYNPPKSSIVQFVSLWYKP